MIEVKNLVKDYGTRRALHGISFKVEKGHIYGFLGPNGAGKSTTMNIITGCLAATSGSVSVDGYDIYKEPIEAKKRIGYLPEIPPLYTDMTVSEYLKFVGRAKGLSGNELYGQLDEVILLTGLERVHERMIRNLSKGYRQRVGIAQALLGNPEVIILDEPTVGLDPIQIIEIRDLIKSFAQNHTVILSSHILQEISAVCDRIIMISNGHVVADDSIEGLEATFSATGTLSVLARTSQSTLRDTLSSVAVNGITLEVRGHDDPSLCEAVLSYKRGSDITEQVWRVLCGAGIPVCAMVPHLMSLEEIFLSLTQTQEQAMAEMPFSQTPDEPKEAEEGNASDDDAAEPHESNDNRKDDDGGDDYKPLFG